MERVHAISELGMCRFDTQAGAWVLVWAVGTVDSSGWSGITLSPEYTIEPPADGIWDFDLLGSPPTQPVIQILLPVADCAVFAAPDWLKGVKVHAETNSMVASTMETAALKPRPATAKQAAAGATIVREVITVFDDSFQPTGMCSLISVRMKKLRHELTLVVEGPDEARIRRCIKEAVAIGLIAAIAAAYPTGGAGLSAAIAAGMAHLKACLGEGFAARVEDRSHWIEWCT